MFPVSLLVIKVMPPETKSKLPQAVLDLLASGNILFYGEFRRGVAVEFSGKGNRVFHQSKCTVETERGVITVTEFLPDSVDWKTWQPPFAKGTMVYGVVRSVEENSGVQVANAKLFAA